MRSLIVRQRQSRGAVIIDLEGRITLGENNGILHRAIREIVAENKLEVILNLAGITKIDSSGLGEIVSARGALDECGGVLKLANISENVADLMMMTKLLTLFDIYDDEQGALDSFEDEREKVTAEIPIISDGRITQEFPNNFDPVSMAKSSIE